MRAQIRLADRQGLLSGRHLSSLQLSEIYYREIEDQAERRDRDQQEFKYALLSTGHVSFSDLFPDMISALENDDFDVVDDGAVIYKFADQPELTPEEIERELAELMAGIDVEVNGGDLYGS